ncbi:hypothetical protein ACHWQZ_G010724 [Mnemiopsis leidyi]
METVSNVSNALDMFTTPGSETRGGIGTTKHVTVTTAKGSMGAEGETTSSTFLYTTHQPPVVLESDSWTVEELHILGAVLWVVIFITLVGNIACFYAVIRNTKILLQHPFFQSNIFCVYLSFVDIFQVVLVGIPAALSYTAEVPDLWNSFYNKAAADPILDFVVWLQLLLVVAICVDRAGHICRPLSYTYTIKAYKTVIALIVCTAIPFLTLTLPHIVASRSCMSYFASQEADPEIAFVCDVARTGSVNAQGNHRLVSIFLSCVLQSNDTLWPGSKSFMMWENVASPMLMFLAVAALAGTSGIIVYKLGESYQLHKNNVEKQDVVARSIRMTCTVSFIQAVVILVSTLPLRWYQIDDRLHATCKTRGCYRIYSSHYKVIARVLVFLGPMLNPWLYPIRMASIRSFLVTKKKSIASSVNTSLLRLKSSLTPSGESTAAGHTQLFSNTSMAATDPLALTALTET